MNNFKLSKQQQNIVESNEDNILVIACPGSGKTHTLIAKYVNMIEKYNLKPEETIMITFTKKAGIEMLNRLNKIIPEKIPYHVGTIHGLSYKILKEYNNLKNIIIDELDVKSYLINIINNQDLKSSEILKLKIQYIIEQSSNIYPFNMKSILKKNDLLKYYKDFSLIYKLYQQNKKKNNIMDFNDLMILINQFLSNNNSSIFKNKIKYVFFDEYQDINSIQNNILLKLSEKSKVMVVGDDAQSIYSFRGSSVKYILNYNISKEHKMYLLEENYRSSSNIVDFCQDIINHNTNQFNKNVKSMNIIKDTKPYIYSFNSNKEEFNWICNDILDKINNHNVKLSDIAILSRKNKILDDIELCLLAKNIYVSKHTGISLLNKPHIKDFIAFIIIINSNSKENHLSLHWKRIINLHNNLDLSELYNNIIAIKNIKSEELKIKSIINYLEKFLDNESKNDINHLINNFNSISIIDFINDIYLNQEVNNLENSIYLSTIHGSKGLEWKYVYIIDVSISSFYFIKSRNYLDEFEEIEEERRLLYVGCSRAKEKLYLTHSNTINPLLREINPLLYIKNSNINKIVPDINISKNVSNYLNYMGYFNIYKSLQHLSINNEIINKKLGIPNNLSYKLINNFINYLIFKIIKIKYSNKISNIQDIIDSKISWENIIDEIFSLDVFKYKDTFNYKKFFIDNKKFYLNLIKGITKLINKINSSCIHINHIVTYANVTCNIDILCDNTIIEIESTLDCKTICERLLYAYILKKNNYNITNIIIYNPIIGEINNFDITKLNIIKFKKIFYDI